jgi:serine/threonine protein phosphatase PrpC
MSEQALSNDRSPRRLTLRAVLRTDVGLVRAENQDFGTFTTPQEETDSPLGGRLLIVADGMGGHRGGATASRLAAETVKAQYLGSDTVEIPIALRESLARANSRIFHEAQINPELRGMGTTTSALAVRNGQGWFAHVGDSRIYLVREGTIRQLTDDHSLVATMVREGLLTAAEAETHPRRNVLQRSMGVAEDVEIDVRGPFDLREGDTFILCSDGLHGVVKEPELREIAELPIDAAADEYLRRALERGAPDNVTVIVARVEEAGESDAAVFVERGDETMVDRLDDTQRLDPVDPTQFDETLRDTDKYPPVMAAEIAAYTERALSSALPQTLEVAQPPVPDAPESELAPDEAPTAEIPVLPASPEAPRVVSEGATAGNRKNGNPVLKWMLVLFVAAGSAVGAWFYWNQQSGASDARPASSSSR